MAELTWENEPVIQPNPDGICNRACVSVKYLPPTEYRPARYKGSILRGQSFTVSTGNLPEFKRNVEEVL